MTLKKKLLVLIVFPIVFCVTAAKAGGQGGTWARPGDLIIRHQGRTFGPVGGIPHIGIYTGNSTTKNGTFYDVIDLGIETGIGVIRPSWSTNQSRFENPGFYSVLESQIPVKYNGRVTTLSALPEWTKNLIRQNICEIAKNDLGSTYGKYEFWQFTVGHSLNCGDWVLESYDKALKSAGVQVLSHSFPKSNLLPCDAGLKHGELKDYSELLWGTTDPSRLPGWLPHVNAPQNRGGVYIAPNSIKRGKGGSDVREEVLKSRPSGDILSWPVDLAK